MLTIRGKIKVIIIISSSAMLSVFWAGVIIIIGLMGWTIQGVDYIGCAIGFMAYAFVITLLSLIFNALE